MRNTVNEDHAARLERRRTRDRIAQAIAHAGLSPTWRANGFDGQDVRRGDGYSLRLAANDTAIELIGLTPSDVVCFDARFSSGTPTEVIGAAIAAAWLKLG